MREKVERTKSKKMHKKQDEKNKSSCFSIANSALNEFKKFIFQLIDAEKRTVRKLRLELIYGLNSVSLEWPLI